jgi:hypothetical protein
MSLRGLIQHKCLTTLFSLHVSQYNFLQSGVTPLVIASAVAQHQLRSKMHFLLQVFCLCFAKHVWLGANCLFHSAQGILTAEKAHEDLVINHYMSCHSDVWRQYCMLCYMLYMRTSSPSRPVYSRSDDSAFRHHHRVD